MDANLPPLRDDALATCENTLAAILAGAESAWVGAWAPLSSLAMTEALYGSEGIRQLLDDGLEYDDYILVGADTPPGHFVFEGLVLGDAGPMPFTVVQALDAPYPLQNILRSGLALASTMEHVGYLESLPHRPEPELLLPARARLTPVELGLAEAFDGLPRGWRSAACAVAAWRLLRARPALGPRPAEKALLAAICYQTGPWRLMPLVTTGEWQDMFGVAEQEFMEAWQYMHGALDLEYEYMQYMPKLPESGVMPDPTTEGDLMSLVSGFLHTLDDEEDWDEDEEEDWDDEEAGEDEDDEGPPGGVFPLFPAGN